LARSSWGTVGYEAQPVLSNAPHSNRASAFREKHLLRARKLNSTGLVRVISELEMIR